MKADGEENKLKTGSANVLRQEHWPHSQKRKQLLLCSGRRQLFRVQADSIRASWKGVVILCAVKVQAAQTVELGYDSGRTLQSELESTFQISTVRSPIQSQTHSVQVPAAAWLGPHQGPLPKAQMSEEML